MRKGESMIDCYPCRGQGYVNVEEKNGVKKEICFRCLGRGKVKGTFAPHPPREEEVGEGEVVIDYAHMLNAIIARWEYATNRFIKAETLLVEMYPWYKRIFVGRKIRKYIMTVKSYENTEDAIPW
jgi:hypothetical protein